MEQKNLGKKLKPLFANGFNHVLHLYSRAANKYAVQSSFLSKGREKKVYVTREEPKKVIERLDGVKPDVITPEELPGLCGKRRLRIVIDAGTIKHNGNGLHAERENYLQENHNDNYVLCSYDISRLEQRQVTQLARKHDNFILTADDSVFLPKSLEGGSKYIGIMEPLVKNELRQIILALLFKKPMCGRSVKMEVYKRFNVLLSSGTLYPLLHILEKEGLLSCEPGVKTKTYSVKNHEKVQELLNNHVTVKNFLGGFMQQAMVTQIT